MAIIFIALIITILIILLIELRFRYSDLYKKGQHIPGPTAIPLFGNVLYMGFTGADFLKAAISIVFEYGGTCRLWIGHKLFVLLSDPDDVENILGSIKYIDKAEEYEVLHPWMGTGLLTSTGEKWKIHRKLITPTFHFKILENFIDAFNKNGDVLIDCLKKHSYGKPLDFHKFATLYTLDVICEATLGVKLNAQIDSESDYVKAVAVAADISFKRMLIPWLKSDYIFPYTPSGRRYYRALDVIHKYSKGIIQKRKTSFKQAKNVSQAEENGIKKKLAFLDMLLECSNDGEYLTDEEIQEEVDTFLFEGHDTTASALSFMIGMLAQHPEIQEKVVDELKMIFGDSDRNPTFADLQEMKYMEQVLKETLRIYPSVPAIARQLKEEYRTKDGHILPNGTTLAFLPIFVQRHHDHYTFAEVFNPDRFDANNYTKHHPYSFIPFSAGPRNCIGQKFATLEIKAAVTKCLRNFQFTIHERIDYDNLRPRLILRIKSGILVSISERKKM